MISDTGKSIIKQFFGGQVSQIADTIAFGTATTAETSADVALGAEVYRVKLSSMSADLINDRIVFKGVVPANDVFDSINEIALFNGTDLVARKVLAAPATIDADLPTEIEYTLGISVV